MDKKKNYYDILDLDKSATQEEIKSAFKLLAKKYHPDINKSHSALEKFREIKEAYDVLIDHELRKEYDAIMPLGKAYSGFCNYHLCKKGGFTLQCKHCGKHFCTDHIRPHEPWLGIPKWGMPENVHQGWTYGTTWYTDGVESNKDWLMPDEIAESAVTGWMDSPGHRKNILTNTYDKEGIGVAVASNGAVYITQDFC